MHFRALVDPLEFAPHDPEVREEIDSVETAEARSMLLVADPQASLHLDISNPRRVSRALEILELTGVTPSQRARDSRRAQVGAYEPEFRFRAVGLDPGDHIRHRIERRLDAMLDAGFLDEVERLESRLGRTARQAVGYRQLLSVVRGECGLQTGVDAARRATVSLARKQRTFFRRDPRIDWIEWTDDPAERLDRVMKSLEQAA